MATNGNAWDRLVDWARRRGQQHDLPLWAAALSETRLPAGVGANRQAATYADWMTSLSDAQRNLTREEYARLQAEYDKIQETVRRYGYRKAARAHLRLVLTEVVGLKDLLDRHGIEQPSSLAMAIIGAAAALEELGHGPEDGR